MYQALLISAAAGFASAFLYGALAPGALVFAPLMFVAPVPLLTVGLGWHPLLAALGALLACLGISLTISTPLALSFAAIIGLPSYLLSQAISTMLGKLSPELDIKTLGKIIGVYILGGIALYAVAAMVFGAMMVEPNYAAFESRVAAAFERMVDMFGGMGDMKASPQSSAQSARIFVRIFLPMSAMLIAFTLTLSLWLSTKLLARLRRLPFPAFPAYEISLPREVLFWFAGAFLLGQLSGYAGMAGSCAMAALLFMLLINGLTLLHKKTLGANARTPLLWAAWLGLALFAPSALIFSLIGALDAAFDVRSRAPGANSSL
jgi:hypothetical protein